MKRSRRVAMGGVLAASVILGWALSAGSQEQLTGDALAEQMGLEKQYWEDGQQFTSDERGILLSGESVPDCPPEGAAGDVVAIKILESGDFYCVVGTSEYEVWELGERLAGRLPSDAEKQEMRKALADE